MNQVGRALEKYKSGKTEALETVTQEQEDSFEKIQKIYASGQYLQLSIEKIQKMLNDALSFGKSFGIM